MLNTKEADVFLGIPPNYKAKGRTARRASNSKSIHDGVVECSTNDKHPCIACRHNQECMSSQKACSVFYRYLRDKVNDGHETTYHRSHAQFVAIYGSDTVISGRGFDCFHWKKGREEGLFKTDKGDYPGLDSSFNVKKVSYTKYKSLGVAIRARRAKGLID